MTRDEFKKQLGELQSVIFSISTYYALWLALWPTEDVVDILNRYKGFFVPLRQALFEMMLIHSAKIFDRSPKAISLWRLLDAAEKDARVVPHAAPGELEKAKNQLSKHERAVMKAISQLRNQRLAHLQASPSQKTTLLKGELDGLVEDFKSVLNDLSAAHDRSSWDWSNQARRSDWEAGKDVSRGSPEGALPPLEGVWGNSPNPLGRDSRVGNTFAVPSQTEGQV